MKKKRILSKLKNYLLGNESSKRTTKTTKKANTEKKTVSEVDFINALNAEIESKDEHFYEVKIQGGLFYLNFNNNVLNIIYHDFYFCTYEESLIACVVADELNNRNSVWTVSTREIEDEKTPISVSLAQTIHLDNDLCHTLQFFEVLISYAFQVARNFRDRFVEVSDSGSSLARNMVNKDYMNRLQYTKQLVDVRTWKKEHPSIAKDFEAPFSVSSFKAFFKDTSLGDIQEITIIKGSDLIELNKQKELQNFNIRNYIRDHFQSCPPEKITFILSFEKEDLTVSLRKLEGSNDRVVFYSLAAIRSGIDIDIHEQQDCVTFIHSKAEIRMTTDREDYWEGKYKIEEAIEKNKSNENSEFSLEQIEFLEQASSDFDKDVYWGMKYHNHEMYYQSLFHFRRVYDNVMRTGGFQIYDENYIKTLAFYLGVAYYHLSLFDRALYYLTQARSLNMILSHKYYISCLRMLNDPDATQTIRDEIYIVTKHFSDEENADRFYPYYLFLKCSLVEQLIDEHNLDEAMALLEKMVEQSECEDFSKDKIELIQSMKTHEKVEKSERTIDSYQWPSQQKNDSNP